MQTSQPQWGPQVAWFSSHPVNTLPGGLQPCTLHLRPHTSRRDVLTPCGDSACSLRSCWRRSQTWSVSSNTFLRRASFSVRF